MKRHAQAYWQKLAASKVIERANKSDVNNHFDGEFADSIPKISDAELLEAYDRSLDMNAQGLVAMELFLREKVRRGL
jgi:hypothetical protein